MMAARLHLALAILLFSMAIYALTVDSVDGPWSFTLALALPS
jgi:hypothetical protein